MDNYITNSIATVGVIIASAVTVSFLIYVNGSSSLISHKAEKMSDRAGNTIENSDILSLNGKTIKGSSIVKELKLYGDRQMSVQVMKEDGSSYIPFIYYLKENDSGNILKSGDIPEENETFELSEKAPFADYYDSSKDTLYVDYSRKQASTKIWYDEIKNEKSEFFIDPETDYTGHVLYSKNASPVGILWVLADKEA